MPNLNEKELAVFKAIAENIQSNTGGQFGYSDEVEIEGVSKRQLSGYVSQLVQKGLFTVDDEFAQVQVGKNFFETARLHAVCVGKQFETSNGDWIRV